MGRKSESGYVNTKNLSVGSQIVKKFRGRVLEWALWDPVGDSIILRDYKPRKRAKVETN